MFYFVFDSEIVQLTLPLTWFISMKSMWIDAIFLTESWASMYISENGRDFIYYKKPLQGHYPVNNQDGISSNKQGSASIFFTWLNKFTTSCLSQLTNFGLRSLILNVHSRFKWNVGKTERFIDCWLVIGQGQISWLVVRLTARGWASIHHL